MDVIIAIGHDGAAETFGTEVQKVIERLGTVNAVVSGPSWSPGWGEEDATWYAATFPSFERYTEARGRILAIAGWHAQDAVAFTIGTTDVAETPHDVRLARNYRDLL